MQVSIICAFVIATVWFPSKAACAWPHTGSYLGLYLLYISFREIEQVTECINAWMDGQTDTCSNGWTARHIFGWMDRRTDVRMDGQTDGRMGRTAISGQQAYQV